MAHQPPWAIDTPKLADYYSAIRAKVINETLESKNLFLGNPSFPQFAFDDPSTKDARPKKGRVDVDVMCCAGTRDAKVNLGITPKTAKYFCSGLPIVVPGRIAHASPLWCGDRCFLFLRTV